MIRRNILLVADGGIGDVLMTTPLIKGLKKKFPTSLISVVVTGKSQQLILTNNPYIDKVIEFPRNVYKNLPNYISRFILLKKGNYYYCLFNHITEQKSLLLLPIFLRIKYRLGFDRREIACKPSYKYFTWIFTKKIVYPHLKKLRTEINLELLHLLGSDFSDTSYCLYFNSMPKYDPPVVGIHPGSEGTRQIKRWPIDFYNKLAKLIRNKFNFNIRFYIGPDELDLISVLDKEFNIIGGKPLEMVITDISRCSYFISNDSGLSHIAAAYKIPTLVVYGPTLKNEYRLPTKYEYAEMEYDCRPCYHLQTPCPYENKCLKLLPIENVLDKFIKLINDCG